MTDFLKIAKSIVVHFAHICAYGVETVNEDQSQDLGSTLDRQYHYNSKHDFQETIQEKRRWLGNLTPQNFHFYI